MKSTVLLLVALLLLCGVLVAGGQPPRSISFVAAVPAGLTQTCAAPRFPQRAALDVDRRCDNDGNGGDEGPQNTAKNNFCPVTRSPTAVTIARFAQLQTRAEDRQIPFGPNKTATDRDPLRTLGEGKLVTLKAYVFIARQEGGESVNCKGDVPDEDAFHDIHISFVSAPTKQIKPGDDKPTKDRKECTGIVGEMSPHHRPPEWTESAVNKLSRSAILVRVTGQQFFDASHVPCSDGEPVGRNPKRISLWEIHPPLQV